MKSFIQRYTESRPGHSKPSSKPSYKTRGSSDAARAAPPVASAPSEKYRSSEDKPYASGRNHVHTAAVIANPPRSQATQQTGLRSASQPLNGLPGDHDARIKRSGKAPIPLSSSEQVSGAEDSKPTRPSLQHDLGPPAALPVTEIWIPPPPVPASHHVSSRPSQGRERPSEYKSQAPSRDMYKESRRGRPEHQDNGRDRERDRGRDPERERDRERKWEKENKREDDNRARDRTERDHTRSRDTDRQRGYEKDRDWDRKREYGSSGPKEKDRSRDRTKERTRDRSEGYERERQREEERYATRVREASERERRTKEPSRLADSQQSKYHSRTRHPTTPREFLESRPEEGDSSDSSRRKLATSSRHTRRNFDDPTTSSRRYREPSALASSSATQAAYPSKHGLSSSMQVHLPGKDVPDRPRNGRADTGLDNNGATSGSENERDRQRKHSRTYTAAVHDLKADTRPNNTEYKNSGWQSEDQRERGYRSDDRSKDLRSHPDAATERTRKGSNASQNARYSPQALGRTVDVSPSSHGHTLGKVDTKRSHHQPPHSRIPSRTPSMIKLNDSPPTAPPVVRSASRTADPSRSVPPSPVIGHSPKGIDPSPIALGVEAVKASSQQHQIWHPPTPVTRDSTPRGALQPLSGSTLLAPASQSAPQPPVTASAPHALPDDSPGQSNYGHFLHPSSAAVPRVRTVSNDSSRNRPKDNPPLKRSPPKDSPVQHRNSPLSDPSLPSEPPNAIGGSPELILPFLLRAPLPSDASPEVTAQPSADTVHSKAGAQSVNPASFIPRPPTSMSVRGKESPTTPRQLSQPLSSTTTSALSAPLRNATGVESFTPPTVVDSSQRTRELISIPPSLPYRAVNDPTRPPDARLERPGGPESRDRLASISGHHSTNSTLTSAPVHPPPFGARHPTPSFNSAQAIPPSRNHTTNPPAALQAETSANSMQAPIPSAPDSSNDAAYRSRYRQDPRPPYGTQSKSSSSTAANGTQGLGSYNTSIPSQLPNAHPQRRDLGPLVNPPLHPGDGRAVLDRSSIRDPQVPLKEFMHQDYLQGPSVSTHNIRTPIQNPRLAELLSSPPPGAMKSSRNGEMPNGRHAPSHPVLSTSRHDLSQHPNDRPQITAPAPILPQQSSRMLGRDELSSGALSEPLRRRASAQKLSAASTVGVPAQIDAPQPSHGFQAAGSQPSNLQHQWSISVSSANATDGSQATVTKRSSPRATHRELQPQYTSSMQPLSQKLVPPPSYNQPSASRPSRSRQPDVSDAATLSVQPQPDRTHTSSRTRTGPQAIDNPAIPVSHLSDANPANSRPTQSPSSRVIGQVSGTVSAPTHTRSRSSVLFNSSGPQAHSRPHHQHSSSLPVVPSHAEDRPPVQRGYNSFSQPLNQPGTSSAPANGHITQADGIAHAMTRKPSEESVLKTPSSLAQSVPVSRTNSVSSQQGRTRKTSLLGIFKRARPPLEGETVGPSPPSVRIVERPDPRSLNNDRLREAPVIPKTKIAPQSRMTTPHAAHGVSNASKIFSPFRLLTSKRHRTVSAASLEAVDGTATNTVVASPTVSMHSGAAPPIQPPPQRDVFHATQMWTQSAMGGRPGVVFEVEGDSLDSPDPPRRKLARRATGRRPSTEQTTAE